MNIEKWWTKETEKKVKAILAEKRKLELEEKKAAKRKRKKFTKKDLIRFVNVCAYEPRGTIIINGLVKPAASETGIPFDLVLIEINRRREIFQKGKS